MHCIMMLQAGAGAGLIMMYQGHPTDFKKDPDPFSSMVALPANRWVSSAGKRDVFTLSVSTRAICIVGEHGN